MKPTNSLVATLVSISVLTTFLVTSFFWLTVRAGPDISSNDPVVLYQAGKLKECGLEYLSNGRLTGAALLDDDDLSRVKLFMSRLFGPRLVLTDIVGALYVNSPEGTKEKPGQPAVVFLKADSQGQGMCAEGSVGSYSEPLFLYLRSKYQDKIER